MLRGGGTMLSCHQQLCSASSYQIRVGMLPMGLGKPGLHLWSPGATVAIETRRCKTFFLDCQVLEEVGGGSANLRRKRV